MEQFLQALSNHWAITLLLCFTGLCFTEILVKGLIYIVALITHREREIE